MPTMCAVPGCKNRGPCFKFPTNPKIRRDWALAIERKSKDGSGQPWMPRDGSHPAICQDHFRTDQMCYKNGRMYLKKGKNHRPSRAKVSTKSERLEYFKDDIAGVTKIEEKVEEDKVEDPMLEQDLERVQRCLVWQVKQNRELMRKLDMLLDTKLTLLICAKCGKGVNSLNREEPISHFRKHQGTFNGEEKEEFPKECHFCDFQPKNGSDLNNHLNRAHLIKMVHKEKLAQKFDCPPKEKLRKQFECSQEKPTTTKKFQCPLENCFYQTGDEKRMTSHKMKHFQVIKKSVLTNKQFSCKNCKLKWKDPIQFLDHHRTVHLELDKLDPSQYDQFNLDLVKVEKEEEEEEEEDQEELLLHITPDLVLKEEDEEEFDDPLWDFNDMDDIDSPDDDEDNSKTFTKTGGKVKKEAEFDFVNHPILDNEKVDTDKIGLQNNQVQEFNELREDTEDKKFCRRCDFNTDNVYSIVYHYHNNHLVDIRDCLRYWDENSPDILRCEECFFFTDMPKVMEYHQESHKYNLYCHAHKLKFSDFDAAKSHDYRKHRDSYDCDECDKSFDNFKSFSAHKKRHLTDCVVCDVCGISIIATRLANHKRHSHIKPFKCTECPFGVGDRAKLSAHMQAIHGGGLPYDFICDICGRQFNRRDKLRVHIKRVHKIDPVTMKPLDEEEIQAMRKKKSKAKPAKPSDNST